MKLFAITSTAIAAMLAGYIALMAVVSSQFNSSANKTWEAMKVSSFECPPGQEVRIDGWGKSGRSRICTNSPNGTWEAWEDGYKHIDGFFKNGQKHGLWTFYSQDGSVSKTITYDMGIEVENDT